MGHLSKQSLGIPGLRDTSGSPGERAQNNGLTSVPGMMLIPRFFWQPVRKCDAFGFSSNCRSSMLCRGGITLIRYWCNYIWSSPTAGQTVRSFPSWWWVFLLFCFKSALCWLAVDPWVFVWFGKTCLPCHHQFPAHLCLAAVQVIVENDTEKLSARAWCNGEILCCCLTDL